MATPQRRRRFWVETAIAGLSGFLAILTLITREWIEDIFGVDPDGGNGSLEWVMVVVLAIVAIGLAVAARAEWRRPALA